MDLKEKEEIMAELEKIDPEGDWLNNTKKFCEAAHPANKEKMWNFYFSKDAKDLEAIEKWGLYDYGNSFRGWNQVIHREFTMKHQEAFFDNIEDIIKRLGRHNAESYYNWLHPTNNVSEELIGKYQALLDKTLANDADNTFFIKMLKDSLTQLKTMLKGYECSLKDLKK